MSKQLLLGDEAIAQAALDAGLSGVYAYPGTPSTEITEYIQMAPITTEQNIHNRTRGYVGFNSLSFLWRCEIHRPFAAKQS